MEFRVDLPHELSNLLLTEPVLLGQEGGHVLWAVWQNLLLDQILNTMCGFSGREGGRKGGREEVMEGGREEEMEGGREEGREEGREGRKRE